MEERFQVKFLNEAAEFLETLEEKARDKVIYNIHKAKITLDKELFKKIQGEIWEFKTLFNKKHYRLFAFWDKTKGNTCCCYTRNHKENTENPAKRNTTGRRDKKRIF